MTPFWLGSCLAGFWIGLAKSTDQKILDLATAIESNDKAAKAQILELEKNINITLKNISENQRKSRTDREFATICAIPSTKRQ